MNQTIPSSALLRALRSATRQHPPPRPCHPVIHHPSSLRPLSTTSSKPTPKPTYTTTHTPSSSNRGPRSTETTQTDFTRMDIYSASATPATSIDACTSNGFYLNNGIHTTSSSPHSGILLLGGEAFLWHPNPTLSKTGIISFPPASLQIFSVLYPKPDLLILGTGDKLWMLDPRTRSQLGELGIRVDCLDTGNASSTYNLLATERGVDEVAGAMLTISWTGTTHLGAKRR